MSSEWSIIKTTPPSKDSACMINHDGHFFAMVGNAWDADLLVRAMIAYQEKK
jgi:hypothetical protein